MIIEISMIFKIITKIYPKITATTIKLKLLSSIITTKIRTKTTSTTPTGVSRLTLTNHVE